MGSNDVSAVSAFIEGAPPGEVCLWPMYCLDISDMFPQLADVVNGTPWPLASEYRIPTAHKQHTDIKSLTEDEPTLLEKARPAFQKYNEEQLTTTKLPGSGKNVRPSRI